MPCSEHRVRGHGLKGILDIGRGVRPTFLGFALLAALEQYVHFQWPFNGPAELVSFFGIQIVALGLCAVLYRFFEIPFAGEASLSSVSSVLVAFFLLYAATERPLGTSSLLLCGFAFAFLYLPWFRALGKLDTKQAFIVVFASQAFAGALGALLVFFPAGTKALVFAVFSLGSTVCALEAASSQPRSALPDSSYEDGSRREPVQYAVLLVLFGLSAGYFNQADSSSLAIDYSFYFASWSVGSAVLSIACTVLVLRHRVEPSLNLVWRLFVVVMLACFLGIQAFPQSSGAQTVVNSLVSMFRTTVVNVFTLAMLDVARYARWKPSSVLCTGYALSIFSFLVPQAVSEAFEAPLSSLPVFWTLAFAVIAASLLLVRERDFSSARVFAELCSPAKPVSAYDAMGQTCEAIARDYGLSKREFDVLRYLSAGRTRAYIAETLFISESTVASHCKHIYQKLGVHSKHELMDFVDRSGS